RIERHDHAGLPAPEQGRLLPLGGGHRRPAGQADELGSRSKVERPSLPAYVTNLGRPSLAARNTAGLGSPSYLAHALMTSTAVAQSGFRLSLDDPGRFPIMNASLTATFPSRSGGIEIGRAHV